MIVEKTKNIPNRKVDKPILLQRKLYLASKANPLRRFGALYDKVYRVDILELAYKRIKANRGVPGIDRKTFEDIKSDGVQKFLKELQQELRNGKYYPQPVLRKYIPKSGGKVRPLGIPTIKDRVVQMATKIVIEPLFEADFQEFSYGFRPKRSAHQAISEVRKYINFGCQEVIEVDLKSFFDTIPHDKLMKLVKQRVSDPGVLKLIQAWLGVGVISEKGHTRSVIGTPQGGVIAIIGKYLSE